MPDWVCGVVPSTSVAYPGAPREARPVIDGGNRYDENMPGFAATRQYTIDRRGYYKIELITA